MNKSDYQILLGYCLYVLRTDADPIRGDWAWRQVMARFLDGDKVVVVPNSFEIRRGCSLVPALTLNCAAGAEIVDLLHTRRNQLRSSSKVVTRRYIAKAAKHEPSLIPAMMRFSVPWILGMRFDISMMDPDKTTSSLRELPEWERVQFLKTLCYVAEPCTSCFQAIIAESELVGESFRLDMVRYLRRSLDESVADEGLRQVLLSINGFWDSDEQFAAEILVDSTTDFDGCLRLMLHHDHALVRERALRLILENEIERGGFVEQIDALMSDVDSRVRESAARLRP